MSSWRGLQRNKAIQRHLLVEHCRRSGTRLAPVNDRLVWIDCEMTGLDLGKDSLIEIAALVTDPDLNVLGDGVDVVIHADDAALGSMVEIVQEMHEKSGLTDAVRASAVS